MIRRTFLTVEQFDVNEVRTDLTTDRKGSPAIAISYGPEKQQVALVTPPCQTHWPRCNGEGNFGTTWGPSDPLKAKFSLDLSDSPFEEGKVTNPYFEQLSAILEKIDDKLLAFVHANQLKLLGRKGLSIDEVKMLQIRSVRKRYNKDTGALVGHSVTLTAPCYGYDGMGGRYKTAVNVYDYKGTAIPDGLVCPGDVCASTMYLKCAYTGVGGDKFGISYNFEGVSVVCQRAKLVQPSMQSCFSTQEYDFAMPYEASNETTFVSDQFSDP